MKTIICLSFIVLNNFLQTSVKEIVPHQPKASPHVTGSRIVGDLNWSISRVCKVRSEPGRSRLGLYNLNWSIVRSVSGAFCSVRVFVFQS